MFLPWESGKKTQLGGSGGSVGTQRHKCHHIPAAHLEAKHQLFGSGAGVHPLPHPFLHPPQWKGPSQGFSKAVCEVSKGQLKSHHSSLHFPLGH